MKHILEFEKWVNVNEKKSKFNATIKTDSDKIMMEKTKLL